MNVPTDALDGIWRLVECRAWDQGGNRLNAPYGRRPMGQISFSEGRILAAIWRGEPEAGPGEDRGYNSYGGRYTLEGSALGTIVDVASDAARVGSHIVREVQVAGGRMVLRTPQQAYGDSVQQREFVWERVWQPSEAAAFDAQMR